MKVLHVITSLKQGGAQTALRNLAERMHAVDSEVIALLPDRTMAPQLEALGIRTTCLDLRRPDALLRLRSAMRNAHPDVVQTWMHHADLIGGAVARAGRLAPVIWNIRNSSFEAEGTPLLTRVIIRACARTSRLIPRRIVCVAESARADHVAAGYDASRMVVIPNGFDLEQLRPDEARRHDVRQVLGFAADDVAFGLIARYHPMKDHATFIRAAALVARQRPEARFLMAGDGVTWSNAPLVGQIRDAGIEARVSLLGRREDVPGLLPALDVACLSSAFAEGFPNAVGEAMACGIPVVATASGDSADVVGPCGTIVPPRDAEAFAAACLDLIAIGPDARARLGAAGRERIRERFSIEATVAAYERLYASALTAS